MSHVMRKPALCLMRTTNAQISLRIRAVWSATSLLLAKEYITSNFYIRNFKPLPSFCGWAGRFESILVENTEDRFSGDVAQYWLSFSIVFFFFFFLFFFFFFFFFIIFFFWGGGNHKTLRDGKNTRQNDCLPFPTAKNSERKTDLRLLFLHGGSYRYDDTLSGLRLSFLSF